MDGYEDARLLNSLLNRLADHVICKVVSEAKMGPCGKDWNDFADECIVSAGYGMSKQQHCYKWHGQVFIHARPSFQGHPD